MRHPARQCFFYGLLCDTLFVVSLIIGPVQPEEGQQCRVQGFMAQLGARGRLNAGFHCVSVEFRGAIFLGRSMVLFSCTQSVVKNGKKRATYISE